MISQWRFNYAGIGLLTAAAVFAACVGTANDAQAQSASQITPKTFAPPVAQTLSAGFSIPEGARLTTPAGAEKLYVRIGGATIQDGFATLEPANRAVIARLAGKRVSAAELFEAARALELAYIKAGYVLVRVVLPPQRLKDGATVRFRVIDGTIERIETKSLPDRVRGRIDAILAPLVGKHGLMLGEIERRVLLAGDVPGVILRSTLAPGSTPGATVLVIEATDQPVNLLVTADNSLSRSLGHYQLGIGADFNSVFGLGELIYVRTNADPNLGTNGFLNPDPRNRMLSAGFILPVGIDGLAFNAEGTQARTDPLATGGIGSADLFQRLSLRLRYPWLRSRDMNFASEIAFDAQDERSSLLLSGFGIPLSEDRLRILRLAGEGDALTSWGGTFNGRAGISLGLDGLGARTAEEATVVPLSRQGADASFSKVEATIGYSQLLAEHLAVNLTAHGQSSLGQALARSEQIGIAGPSALSAFDTGTLQGDSGVVGRGEVSAPYALPPVFTSVGVAASPYLFGAVGELLLQQPTSLEQARTTAASYGAGLRLGGGAAGVLSNGSLTLEFARQARNDGLPAGNRFTMVSALKF